MRKKLTFTDIENATISLLKLVGNDGGKVAREALEYKAVRGGVYNGIPDPFQDLVDFCVGSGWLTIKDDNYVLTQTGIEKLER